jgi:hypothetical protein
VATIFIALSSVIVHDLYVGRTVVRPTEANAPLVIDPNRKLTFAAAFESFEAVGGRGPQVIERFSSIKGFELASRDLENLNRKALGTPAVEYGLGGLALEVPDQRAVSAASSRLVSIADTNVN